MGELTRAISADGGVVACALNSTDIVAAIEEIHQTSAVVTAGLGRLATAASMIGYSLKGEDDSLTLRMNGGGATGSLIAVSNSKGNVKAFVENPIVELPLNKHGKLDVSGAIGSNGFLTVIKDLGLKEPYAGQVPLVSGEVAEDITSYFALSEQQPTVCGLGVLVNPNLTVAAAGGYLVQLLPFADESCIDILERNVGEMPSVSSMIQSGRSTAQIIELLLKDLEPHVLEQTSTSYRCDCSKERVEKALLSMGKQGLTELRDEQEQAEVCCHFCPNKYYFSREEISEMLERG